MTRVCFFGAYDPAYPRNRLLRGGLAAAGLEVCEARVRETRAFRRWPALAAAFGRSGIGADVVLVPEFRHKDVALARVIAAGRPLVFDPLVSRVDTLVEDWGLHARGSPQSRWNAVIDRVALGLPDVVLCDTWAHGRLFESLGVRSNRLRRVLVGAEAEFFAVPPRVPEPVVRVLYLGGFLPLHGVLHVIEAAAILERTPGLPPWELVLVGRGIEWEAAQHRASERGLRNVCFPGRTDYADAPKWFAEADLVLGAFGAGAKAGRVIPHKVYQGLAAGRAVVTGDGEGVRELLTDGVDVALAPRGDPGAIAAVLAAVLADPARCARLGAAGRARALQVATPERIGASLAAVIAEAR